jgi:alginate O-acetyltransferase complex protein AlgI
MVFSSQLFLYGFAPIFFSLYFLSSERWKNTLILTASLIFYAIGASAAVLVLLLSIWINQFLAVRIEKSAAARRRSLLAVGITVNLLALAYYKYTIFLW